MKLSARRVAVPRIVSPASLAPATSPPLWPVAAVLFASTSVIVGVLWDISWHQSIGRDTFWSPPHLAIYLGGVVAGVACGAYVLLTTFRGTEAQRATSVRFWGFLGPLGAWTCIWGAIAMLTSAPFDDWWHNAYGLDVKILSPPHAVLALGVWAIQLGAMLLVLALQNRSEAQSTEQVQQAQQAGSGPAHAVQRQATGHPQSLQYRSDAKPSVHPATNREAAAAAARRERLFRWMFLYAAGLVLLNVATVASEHTWRIFMHNAAFYQVVCAAFPIVLVAAARASRLPWAATATAGVYMGVTILMMWVLQLFPAEPKLAPVLREVTRMVPPFFPLLLVVPALAVDLVLRRWNEAWSDWLLAPALGVAFFAAFFPVQWLFADFLHSHYSRNWFFATHLLPYMVPPTSAFATGEYVNQDATTGALLGGLAVAVLLGVASARLGLGWGRWMRRVQR